jgi:hypothetical protein
LTALSVLVGIAGVVVKSFRRTSGFRRAILGSKELDAGVGEAC